MSETGIGGCGKVLQQTKTDLMKETALGRSKTPGGYGLAVNHALEESGITEK